MSYYYDYYVGYKKDGKIYPLGPYDSMGKLRPALSRSRSFASDLYNEFYPIKEAEISDELRARFESEDWNGKLKLNATYLTESDLSELNSNYIKSGYFLISDVESYEKDGYTWDIFYDKITPQVYAAKLQHELTFGKNQPQKDIEGNEYTEPNASDYMYYAYPDFNSKEYEVSVLKSMIEILRTYELKVDEYVIILSEG